tara:strand:- start:566 stop:1429 length:864 start_codon:yes stop_codon:yes gene_type:complete
MKYSSEDIRKLRDKTGAGMMDCKKALDESDGNIENAVEWLRKKGINTAEKKSSRDASDGLITVQINDISGVIIEINSETDFVARNENFQEFCDLISNLCLEEKIDSVENLLESKSNNIPVKQILTDLIAKLGENLIIKKLDYYNDSNLCFQKYVHNSVNHNSGKIGVILVYSTSNKNDEIENFSRNLSMHIAASDPKSLEINALDPDLINKERAIYTEQLIDSNKPQDIIEKIVDGKIKKFYDQVCLLEQFFVMDPKVKIKDVIQELNKNNNNDFKIIKYYMYKLGQ